MKPSDFTMIVSFSLLGIGCKNTYIHITTVTVVIRCTWYYLYNMTEHVQVP